jgi:hypothetical protein
MVEKIKQDELKENGLGSEEFKNWEVKSSINLKQEEINQKEKENNKIYNSLFGIDSSNVSVEESNKSKEKIRQEFKHIVENSNFSDYVTLDVQLKGDNPSLKKVFDVSLLEKMTHTVLSLDKSIQKFYEKKLEQKYLPSNNIERLKMIVSQHDTLLSRALGEYREIISRVQNLANEIKNERIKTEQDSILANQFIENCYKLDHVYQSKLNKILSDIQKAQNDSKPIAVILNLESIKDEIYSKKQDNMSKMNQTFKQFQSLDKQIDYLAQKEDNLKESLYLNHEKINDLVLIKNFLNIAERQYDISLKISSLSDSGSNMDPYVIKSPDLVKRLNELNSKIDQNITLRKNDFSTQVEDLVNVDTSNSNSKYKSQRYFDVEKIKTETERIMNDRREKNLKIYLNKE